MKRLILSAIALALLSWPALAQAPLSPGQGGTGAGAITGSTQCVHVNTSGVFSGVGADCGTGGASGTPTNPQTGTTYVVLASDQGKIVTLHNASSVAVTLPQAGTTGFAATWGTCILNLGAGTATVTPTTSTFNLNASQTLPAGASMCPVSDGTNYAGSVSSGATGGSGTVTSVGLTVPSFLTVTGSPVTGSGVLAVTATSESANTFLAAPNGSAGGMTPRAIVTADTLGTIGMEIDLFYNGVPGNSAILAKTFSRATTVAASAPIKCSAIVGATSSATVTLAKVTGGTSTNIGTLVFAASGSAYQSCTVTFSSSVSFAAGDLLTETFPSSADATLANVAISVPAVQ